MIINSIFPEKLTFENNDFRTTKSYTAISFIYQINSELKSYKKRKGDTKSPKFGFVLETDLTSNQILKDLRKIADLPNIEDNLSVLGSNQIEAVDVDFVVL